MRPVKSTLAICILASAFVANSTWAADRSCAKYNVVEPMPGGSSIATLEFDDVGEPLDAHAVDDIRKEIQSQPEGTRKPILAVFFVHGWLNSACSHNYKDFQEAIKWVASAETSFKVAGVYVAWNGSSLRGVPNIPLVKSVADYSTFWSRKRAAVRVAGVPATGAILQLIDAIRESDRMQRSSGKTTSKIILIGHSFGARIVEFALAQAFVAKGYDSSIARLREERDTYHKAKSDLVEAKKRVNEAELVRAGAMDLVSSSEVKAKESKKAYIEALKAKDVAGEMEASSGDAVQHAARSLMASTGGARAIALRLKSSMKDSISEKLVSISVESKADDALRDIDEVMSMTSQAMNDEAATDSNGVRRLRNDMTDLRGFANLLVDVCDEKNIVSSIVLPKACPSILLDGQALLSSVDSSIRDIHILSVAIASNRKAKKALVEKEQKAKEAGGIEETANADLNAAFSAARRAESSKAVAMTERDSDEAKTGKAGSTLYLDVLDATRPPADLTILINPATEALHTQQLIREMCKSPLVRFYRSLSAARPPWIVSMSSLGDWATREAFPLGATIGSVMVTTRSVNGNRTGDCAPDIFDESQQKLITHTAANLEPFQSHEVCVREGTTYRCPSALKVADSLDSEMADAIPYVKFGNNDRYSIQSLPHQLTRNSSPYWILSIPTSVVPSHSDIWRDDFKSLIGKLLLKATEVTNACDGPSDCERIVASIDADPG